MHHNKDWLDSLSVNSPKTRDSYYSQARQNRLDTVEENREPKIPIFDNFNRGRVAIFIDGRSLFYAALHLGIEINYTKLIHCLAAGNKLFRPYFYTGVDPSNNKQHSFLLWMRRHGYRVVAKELIEFADGSKKADLNIEITVDMMSLIDSYDTAVLVSGDGDLAYAVNAISYKGVRVEIVGLNFMTSDSLINVADAYVDLLEIQSRIHFLDNNK